MKTCVVMPAYNEAKTIGDLVRAVRHYVPDVVVINDGSSDDTQAVAAKSGAVVLSNKKNSGKGAALRRGFDYALRNNYDALVIMDADGQHIPQDLPAIVQAGFSSPDIGAVVGNRVANPQNMPVPRFLTNVLMSLVVSMICKQTIPDSQCGFKFLKCGALKGMRLISSHYDIETEILIKVARQGLRIRSVPIRCVYAGQKSFINPVIDTWRFLVLLVRLTF